jgi:predicted metal-dependent phosphoesterase TrpH
MHILGYYIDDGSLILKSKLAELRIAREERNPKIASRLRALGIHIDYDEVMKSAGSEVVGRPHFAQLMVKKGYAQSMQDAFNRFLAKGAPAFVDKRRLSPAESIELIHSAGGVAVLAHPYQLKPLPLEEQGGLIGELAALGLDGVEAIYSRHSQEQRETYSKMAARHGLLVTGGSDFHGSYKPDIDIVRGLGDLKVPYSLLEALRDRVPHWLKPADGISDEASDTPSIA